MGLMGYDAAGIGERELGFGYDKLKDAAAKSKTPFISSNLIDKKSGKTAFKPYVVVKKGGLKVGIFSVLGPKIELPANTGEQLTIDDPIATAQKMVAELRKQSDVVIALTHLGRVEGEDLAAQVPGIDVVVLGHHPGFVAQGRRVNSAITVAMARGSSGSTYAAASPHTSGSAPRLDTTTGTPAAIASTAGIPKPSSNDGSTNRRARS